MMEQKEGFKRLDLNVPFLTTSRGDFILERN
jgi:hypothetical protein